MSALAPRPAALLAVVFLGCLAALSGACGRKTKVLPPDLVAPQAVEGVTVTNKLDGIEIEWERPTRYVDGSTMLDLDGFRIERRRACCGYQTIVDHLPIEDRFRFRRAKTFRFLDTDVSPGEIYLYRIVAFTIDDYESAPSEPVEIQRQPPISENAGKRELGTGNRDDGR